MTEMVLLFPLFLFFMFGFVKVFALLVLVQKVEIASVYAATRWQFESHRNVVYAGFDAGALLSDIRRRTSHYIGFDSPSVRKFLDLDKLELKVDREAVWNMVTLRVTTRPWGLKFLEPPEEGPLKRAWTQGFEFKRVKYVPSRDRPIRYILPGGE